VGEPSHEQRREVVEGGGRRVSEPIFKIAPETFDGIELGGIGWEKEHADIGGQAKMAGFVKRAVVEQQQMEAGGVKGGEMVEKELKAFGIEGGKLQKKTRPGERFHRAIQIQALKAVGAGQHGLDAARSNPLPHDGQEPALAFILRPYATVRIAPLVSSVDCGQELSREGVLKLSDCFRVFFGCERRGGLGLAWSW
jgi:hypothetical protein